MMAIQAQCGEDGESTHFHTQQDPFPMAPYPDEQTSPEEQLRALPLPCPPSPARTASPPPLEDDRRSRSMTPSTGSDDDTEEGPDASYVCRECGKSFSRKDTFKRHLRLHSGRFVCEICQHASDCKSKYDRHMVVHTRQRPFRCTECNQGFTQNSSLQSHIRCVHEKIKPHSCPQCKRAFSTRAVLRRHVMTHEQANKRPRFRCRNPGCDKAYANQANLRRHEREGCQHAAKDGQAPRPRRSRPSTPSPSASPHLGPLTSPLSSLPPLLPTPTSAKSEPSSSSSSSSLSHSYRRRRPSDSRSRSSTPAASLRVGNEQKSAGATTAAAAAAAAAAANAIRSDRTVPVPGAVASNPIASPSLASALVRNIQSMSPTATTSGTVDLSALLAQIQNLPGTTTAVAIPPTLNLVTSSPATQGGAFFSNSAAINQALAAAIAARHAASVAATSQPSTLLLSPRTPAADAAATVTRLLASNQTPLSPSVPLLNAATPGGFTPATPPGTPNNGIVRALFPSAVAPVCVGGNEHSLAGMSSSNMPGTPAHTPQQPPLADIMPPPPLLPRIPNAPTAAGSNGSTQHSTSSSGSRTTSRSQSPRRTPSRRKRSASAQRDLAAAAAAVLASSTSSVAVPMSPATPHAPTPASTPVAFAMTARTAPSSSEASSSASSATSDDEMDVVHSLLDLSKQGRKADSGKKRSASNISGSSQALRAGTVTTFTSSMAPVPVLAQNGAASGSGGPMPLNNSTRTGQVDATRCDSPSKKRRLSNPDQSECPSPVRGRTFGGISSPIRCPTPPPSPALGAPAQTTRSVRLRPAATIDLSKVRPPSYPPPADNTTPQTDSTLEKWTPTMLSQSSTASPPTMLPQRFPSIIAPAVSQASVSSLTPSVQQGNTPELRALPTIASRRNITCTSTPNTANRTLSSSSYGTLDRCLKEYARRNVSQAPNDIPMRGDSFSPQRVPMNRQTPISTSPTPPPRCFSAPTPLTGHSRQEFRFQQRARMTTIPLDDFSFSPRSQTGRPPRPASGGDSEMQSSIQRSVSSRDVAPSPSNWVNAERSQPVSPLQNGSEQQHTESTDRKEPGDTNSAGEQLSTASSSFASNAAVGDGDKNGSPQQNPQPSRNSGQPHTWWLVKTYP